MVDLAKFKAKFIEESKTNIADLGKTVEALQSMRASKEAIEPGFRAAHSIKGSAGIFGYERLSLLAVEAEAVLYALLNEQTQQSPEVVSALGDAHATFDLMVDCIENDVEAATGIEDGIKVKLSHFYQQNG